MTPRVSNLDWAQQDSSAGLAWVCWWVGWDEGVSNVFTHVYGGWWGSSWALSSSGKLAWPPHEGAVFREGKSRSCKASWKPRKPWNPDVALLLQPAFAGSDWGKRAFGGHHSHVRLQGDVRTGMREMLVSVFADNLPKSTSGHNQSHPFSIKNTYPQRLISLVLSLRCRH